jgi:hypothetical protein
LKAGVPQGSVLVPLLFLLFINDIADDIQSLVRLFADDSSLIFSSTNPLEVEDRLNLDLQVLDNWAKQWLVEPHFINRPNILKFCNLMNSKSVSVLCNMCKYIRIVNMRICPPG